MGSISNTIRTLQFKIKSMLKLLPPCLTNMQLFFLSLPSPGSPLAWCGSMLLIEEGENHPGSTEKSCPQGTGRWSCCPLAVLLKGGVSSTVYLALSLLPSPEGRMLDSRSLHAPGHFPHPVSPSTACPGLLLHDSLWLTCTATQLCRDIRTAGGRAALTPPPHSHFHLQP